MWAAIRFVHRFYMVYAALAVCLQPCRPCSTSATTTSYSGSPECEPQLRDSETAGRMVPVSVHAAVPSAAADGTTQQSRRRVGRPVLYTGDPEAQHLTEQERRRIKR